MRAICSACQYPLNTCVCQWIQKVDTPIKIIVLQHHKEMNQAKNTVKLAKLAIPDLEQYVVENELDIKHILKELRPFKCAVLFPFPCNQSFESHIKEKTNKDIDCLIFIDGSWKQAGGIANSLAGFSNLTFLHFEQPPNSRYQIRHTKKDQALSTLEAIACAIEKGWSVDTTPLHDLLAGFQSHWQGPKAHRRTI